MGHHLFTPQGARAALAVLLLAVPATTQAAWPNDPYEGNVPVCTAAYNVSDIHSIPDGAGGAFVTWADGRAGGISYDIYVQRISAAGVPLWTANGVALCTASSVQSVPQIISDGAGGAIVTWQDQRSGTSDIYARRVNSSGLPQWTANGVAICSATGPQSTPVLASDNAGGAIIAWSDLRGATYDIYAQRVNSTGTVLWAANGVALSSAAGDQATPRMTSDDAGGALVAWHDSRTGNFDIYAQRVNSSGVAQWTANGVAICTSANNQLIPEIVADGHSGAIVTWEDDRSGVNYDIYAQRINAAGLIRWATNGSVVCAATGQQDAPKLVSDGAGGAIIAWNDYRSGSYDIYAQRMSSAGGPLWTTDGLALGTGTYSQYDAEITSDGAGGAIVSWHDFRSVSYDIYVQRVSASGAPQWTSNGALVCGAPDDQTYCGLVEDGAGGAIAVWLDWRNGLDSDLYAQRVERFGRLGNPEPVITSVKDVRNDQGGVVKVSWAASYLDADPTYGVNDYRVWRSLPAFALATRQAALRRGVTTDSDEAAASGKLFLQPFAAQGYAWELVGTQAAAILPSYSYAAATLGDSVAGSFPRTAFMVEARQSTSLTADRWFSAPDSGYSVDNLAPAAPAPLTGFYSGGSTRLAWNPNHEADLAGYRVYRGSSTAFVPGPANLLSAQPDTGAVDAAGAPYVYKVTAVDVHGNESPVATLVPTGTLDADGAAPARAFFTLASANPSRGATQLRFGLVSAAHAEIALYDAGGRRVRMLRSGTLEAGEHSVQWDGRDDAGHEAPAGLYFARCRVGGEVRQLRIVRTR